MDQVLSSHAAARRSGRQGAVDFLGVTKRFDDTVAVDDVDLQVEPGEFISLLGPSGCGKTTSLRMVAGFEDPTEGEILISGERVNDVPPHQRNVNTVFQSYALFPHMSVGDNVAYGLTVTKTIPRAEIPRLVKRALQMVQLDHLSARRPAALSGGEQQRVALARAIVKSPDVLLLDEPLSALDLKLRQAMRLELKQLHDELGITFLFVTHDQEEAITMSDRIAVMDNGRVLQLGTPSEVYEEPTSRFVANFIGETNFLEGDVVGFRDGIAEVALPAGDVIRVVSVTPVAVGERATITLRPHRVEVVPAGEDERPGEQSVKGTLTALLYLGESTRVSVTLPDGTELVAVRPNDIGFRALGELRPGDTVELRWDVATAARLVREG